MCDRTVESTLKKLSSQLEMIVKSKNDDKEKKWSMWCRESSSENLHGIVHLTEGIFYFFDTISSEPQCLADIELQDLLHCQKLIIKLYNYCELYMKDKLSPNRDVRCLSILLKLKKLHQSVSIIF